MNTNNPLYCNLHCHSNSSDGNDTVKELIERAIRENGEGNMILAITDHNLQPSYEDFLALQKEYGDKIILVPGCEISTSYRLSTGKQIEIHIIGLGCHNHAVDSPRYVALLKRNQNDKRPYIEQILAKLELVGIHLVDDYEELVEFAAPSPHIGRMVLARMMVKKRLAKTIDECFDNYFGSYGKRTCYVDNPFTYVSIEEAVLAIREAGGIPILCHPFFYTSDREELMLLIQHFVDVGGLAIETEYAQYTKEQQMDLKAIARKFGLAESAGSDYHGNEHEHLAHRFSSEIYFKLRNLISNTSF